MNAFSLVHQLKSLFRCPLVVLVYWVVQAVRWAVDKKDELHTVLNPPI